MISSLKLQLRNREFIKRINTLLKESKEDIILIVTVFLISLLSFGVGYIVALHYQKEPLRFEEVGLLFKRMEFAVGFF